MSRHDLSMQLLEAYATTSERERLFRLRMIELLSDPNCFDRDLLTPGHFTASAFIVSPDGGQLLLIYHRSLKLWLQPGGHIESTDPSLVAAARREVLEETGLGEVEPLHAGVFDLDVHAIPSGKQPAHEHFDVRFAFRSASTSITPASDALDARWVDLDRVAEQQTDESVMRAVRRLRRIRQSGAN